MFCERLYWKCRFKLAGLLLVDTLCLAEVSLVADEVEVAKGNSLSQDDMAAFASQWLETDCGTCGGADLDGDNDTDMNDWAIFSGFECLTV